MASIDVSIVIVNWNTCDILRDCLKSVYEQTKKISFEVIVIDNASQDGSPDMVKTEFPRAILIANQKNKGFAAANNQGITVAKGRYVLLLNSDTVILDDAVSKSVFFTDGNPNAAVVGCRVLNPDRSLQQTCFMFPSLLNLVLSSTYAYKLFAGNRFFGRERMTWWERDDQREVDVVTGCFMLVRREAIEHIGKFDEQFFMYAEETDWCYRFKQAGFKIMFTPEAEIIHLKGASSRKIRPEMVLQLRSSILLFLKKHRGRVVYSLGCLLMAFFFLLRVPYWVLLGVFSSDNRKYGFITARTYLKGVKCVLTGWRGLCVQRGEIEKS